MWDLVPFQSSTHVRCRANALLFFFFFTLDTGPRRSLSLKLSDTRVRPILARIASPVLLQAHSQLALLKMAQVRAIIWPCLFQVGSRAAHRLM